MVVCWTPHFVWSKTALLPVKIVDSFPLFSRSKSGLVLIVTQHFSNPLLLMSQSTYLMVSFASHWYIFLIQSCWCLLVINHKHKHNHLTLFAFFWILLHSSSIWWMTLESPIFLRDGKGKPFFYSLYHSLCIPVLNPQVLSQGTDLRGSLWRRPRYYRWTRCRGAGDCGCKLGRWTNGEFTGEFLGIWAVKIGSTEVKIGSTSII